MGWSVALLGEVADRLDMLEVHCGRCDRHGHTVMRALTADCPNRDAQHDRQRCDPYAPEVWEFFGKAAPSE